jgi:hypothetical protein
LTPSAHRDGTLRLYDRFGALAGGHPQAAAVRALLAAAELPGESSYALKYDVYLACGPDGLAWGATVNERWQPRLLEGDLAALGHDLGPCRRLRSALGGELTLSFAFDTPARPLRLKAYVQEARWGDGIGSARALAPLLHEIAPGCRWPEWIEPGRSVGVLALQLDAAGAGIKAYLGGATAAEAAAGAPIAATALAQAMASASPLTPAYHYLTVRLAKGREPRYAINKIYEVAQIAGGTEARRKRAWSDAKSLFVTQGRRRELRALLAALAPLHTLRVVPTATALEAPATVDVYCAAWSAQRAANAR